MCSCLPHKCALSYVQVQCYLPLQQLHTDFRDFSDGDCHVMNTEREQRFPGGISVCSWLHPDVLSVTEEWGPSYLAPWTGFGIWCVQVLCTTETYSDGEQVWKGLCWMLTRNAHKLLKLESKQWAILGKLAFFELVTKHVFQLLFTKRMKSVLVELNPLSFRCRS